MCSSFLKVASEWQEPLKTQKTKLTVQLQKMQDQVRKAYFKLKHSNVFKAEMFLEVFVVNVHVCCCCCCC